MSDTFYSGIEWLAAVAGLINVYLLTRQSIFSWPAGLMSVFLYAFVFYHNHLYSDVILHGIYTLLNIYGWYKWSKPSANATDELPVSKLTVNQLIILSALIIVGFLIWGYIVGKTTTAVYIYPDAFILVTSLCAQYLLTVKKIENWILWIIVDIIAITIYFLQELYITSGLYFIYLLLCIHGYNQWLQSYRKTPSSLT
ncbi:MAG: nicotinamide riboside transporter PnuC [Saprospiraceae bacterium]